MSAAGMTITWHLQVSCIHAQSVCLLTMYSKLGVEFEESTTSISCSRGVVSIPHPRQEQFRISEMPHHHVVPLAFQHVRLHVVSKSWYNAGAGKP